MRRLLAAAVLPALAACGSADPQAIADTVRLTEKAHHDAIVAKDAYGATRSYADDATLTLPNTGVVTGKAALDRTYEAYLADPNFAIAMEEGPVWASGDLAVTTYTAQVTMSDAQGNPVTLPVANQTVWSKVDGTGWQIVSEHNAELPAEAAAEG